jgi:hypothetical protein
MDDDEATQRSRYVGSHCRRSMTDAEQRPDLAGVIGLEAAEAEARGSATLARTLRECHVVADDHEVRVLPADGFETFRRRVTLRLLADVSVQAMIKWCSRCDRVVLSPRACQCLWCEHVWRDRSA